MSYHSQRIAIETRFKQQWEILYPTIPIVWPNLQIPQPQQGYVQIHILNGDSALKGLGSMKLYRYVGLISLDLYIPLLKGTIALDNYADSINDIFRGQSFTDITCRAVVRQDFGLQNGYWRSNLSIPFYRNTHHLY